MAINPTNLARVCTAKWQPLWIKKGTHKYCQVFVSPYNWDHTYFYDGEWVAVNSESDTLLVYEGSNFREYNSETDGYKVQYGNKKVVEQPEPPVPPVVTQYTVTIVSNNTDYGTVDESELVVDEWTTLSASDNVLSVWSTDVTATAETGYEFSSWTVGWESLPATVTDDITITATFQAEPVPPTPTGDYRYIKWHVTGTWDTWDPSLELSQIMASRFVLTDWVNEMTYPVGTTASTNATNDWSQYSETPANLLDGTTSTKMVVGWNDTPYSAIDVIIDLGSWNGFDPTEYDHYQWYTANDSFWWPEVYRNPVSWEIQLSEDGTTWETWDTQTDATLVEENQVAAWTWSLTAPL